MRRWEERAERRKRLVGPISESTRIEAPTFTCARCVRTFDADHPMMFLEARDGRLVCANCIADGILSIPEAVVVPDEPTRDCITLAWCPICHTEDVHEASVASSDLFIRGFRRAWVCSSGHLLATKGIVIEHLATDA